MLKVTPRTEPRADTSAARQPQPAGSASSPRPGRLLVTTEVPEQKTAWTKARQDVMAITSELGYETLVLPAGMSPWAWTRFALQVRQRVGEGGVVLVEYPFEQRRRLYPLCAWCRLKGIRLCGLIHDLHAPAFWRANLARDRRPAPV